MAVPPPDHDELAIENDELRRRLSLAQAELEELRRETLERRAEVRHLAEAFPAAMSRRSLLSGMLRDAIHHPDKPGFVRRAVAKLGRAPRRLARDLRARR